MSATLRRQLLRSTLAIVVAMAAVLGVASGSLFSAVARDEEELRLGRQAETLMATLGDRLLANRTITAKDLAALAPQGDALILRTPDGAITRTPALHTPNTVSVAEPGPSGALLTLITDGRQLDRRVHNAWLVIAATCVAVVAAAAALADLQARRLSRPMTRLAAAAAQMGAGDFSMEAPRSDLVELDTLARALDHSARQIAMVVRSEREFSANASHQLRSPLTAIAMRLELITSSNDPIARAEALAALEELHGLDQHIDELMLLARTGRVAEPKRCDVVALVAHHVDRVRPRFEAMNRRLTLGSPPALEVVAVAGALGQAVEILLDNALTHGCGDVDAAVRAVDNRIEIEIRDQGSMLTPQTRNPEHRPGHGVGLVLARDLLRGDGGTVELTASAPTTFVIHLPVKN